MSNEKNNNFNSKINVLYFLIIALYFILGYVGIKQIGYIQNSVDLIKQQSIKVHLLGNDSKIIEDRLRLIEGKYIDVLAARETINFWLAIFLFLIPIILGYTVYQKNQMMRDGDHEISKIKELERELKENLIFIKTESQELKDDMKELRKESEKALTSIKIKSEKALTLIIKEAEEQRSFSERMSVGNKKWGDGEYGEALKEFKDAVNLKSENAEGYDGLGRCNLSLGDHKKAIKLFKRAIKKNNNFHLAHYNLACAYSLSKEKKLAYKSLENSFETNRYSTKYAREKLYIDEDFENIRNEEEFKAFEQKIKDEYDE